MRLSALLLASLAVLCTAKEYLALNTIDSRDNPDDFKTGMVNYLAITKDD